MPMIDVYATAGTFPATDGLAQELAQAVMRWEQVPDMPLFKLQVNSRVDLTRLALEQDRPA